MKKFSKLFGSMVVGAACMAALVSCGSAGPKGDVGEKGDKGDKGDTGERGPAGVSISKSEINEDGELVLTYSDGKTVNLGVIKGSAGLAGKGIKDSAINEDGELVLTYTDDTTVNIGKVKGADGLAGKGIKKTEINEDGELIITYTDDTTANVGVVKGQDAETPKAPVDAYQIAKSFGYKGSYGQWFNQVVNGELSPQYAVTVSDDYSSFTYGWDEKSVTLGEHAILLDSRFTDAEVEEHDFIFNDIKAAIEAAKAGTEADPMVIYMAPGVYWTHDPESESTTDAYQITKTCANMHWEGLTDDYRNVVIAFNYGHNVGYAGGNPTCFNIGGDGFNIRNLTVGGFCNIDLEFNLNTDFNHLRRTTDVTQCQLGSYSGDKLYCENVAFISRLNMMPFNNSKRALYVGCHMESTDDSLNGSSKAVYLNCDLDFYASKPWGGASGATLLNCDLNIKHINIGLNPVQYLTKMAGRVNVIDCRYHDNTNAQTYKIGWSDILSSTFRSYYSNVTYNGVKTDFSDGGVNADKGIDLTGTEALKAYKLTTSKGQVIYNVYNLLRGTDGWDPLGQKEIVEAFEADDIAITLNGRASATSLETGKTNGDTSTITYTIAGPQNTRYASEVTYSVKDSDKQYVELTTNEDGSCTVKAINEQEETVKVVVELRTAEGLGAAVELTVAPSKLAVDSATNLAVVQNANGTATVSYDIANLGTREDNSRINWYICDDAAGTNPVQIATGRGTTPLKTIQLQQAWVGKYLMVKVESKHIRSDYATAATVIAADPIAADGIEEMSVYNVDLASFVTTNNAAATAGFWTVNNVAYGTGAKNGFIDYTGVYFTGSKSTAKPYSEIDYNPVAGTYGDMDLTFKVAPGKTAGQGFGSNDNFIEIRIKYDTATDTGYALRITRNSGDSTYASLVKLSGSTDGVRNVEELARTSASTSVYLTECTIHVWTDNGKLNCHIETDQEQPETAKEKSYLAEVDLTADIEANDFGGFGAYYQSSTGDNTTYIGSIVAEWK